MLVANELHFFGTVFVSISADELDLVIFLVHVDFLSLGKGQAPRKMEQARPGAKRARGISLIGRTRFWDST